MSSDLKEALQTLLDAAAAALALRANDDTSEVATQAREAVADGDELQAQTARREAMAILHRINNRLAAALSYALLAEEELEASDPGAAAALAVVATRVRAAADEVKRMSASLAAEPD